MKLAEVIAGCPDPRAQGQAVWIQLLHGTVYCLCVDPCPVVCLSSSSLF